MMPDTCVPTSISVTGFTVPVAVTELLMEIVVTLPVSMEILSLDEGLRSTPATTRTATAQRMIIINFLLFFFILCCFLSFLIDVEDFDVHKCHIFGLEKRLR